MGKLDARQRLTVVRKLCGHDAIGPSGVSDQSLERTNSPILPPPTSQLALESEGAHNFELFLVFMETISHIYSPSDPSAPLASVRRYAGCKQEPFRRNRRRGQGWPHAEGYIFASCLGVLS